MIRNAFSDTWTIFKKTGPKALMIIALIYWPLDLVQSYADYHVIDPDNVSLSYRLTAFFDLFILVIPDAAIYFLGIRCLSGEKVGLFGALVTGVKSYGRMWMTRLFVYLSSLSLILFILPGVYLLTRWCMVEVITVAEGQMGTRSFKRSWALSKKHVWPLLGALLTGMLTFGAATGMVLGISFLLPDLWWIDALTSMAVSLIIPLWLFYEVSLYMFVYRNETEGEGPAGTRDAA